MPDIIQQKQIKRVFIRSLDESTFDAPLSDTIDLLQSIVDKESEGYLDLEMSYTCDEDEGLSVYLYCRRLETEDEFNKRINAAQLAIDKKQAMDLKLYLELKAKFENK